MRKTKKRKEKGDKMTVSRREFFKIGGLSMAAAGWTKKIVSLPAQNRIEPFRLT